MNMFNNRIMLTGGPRMSLAVRIIMGLCLMLTWFRLSEAFAQHQLIGEPCGPDVGTCSTNQALRCDLNDQVCVCPEGSEWVQEHETRPHICRITPGNKCTYMSLESNSLQCMGNYHCMPDNNGTVVEGADVNTICKCGSDHGCVPLDTSHEDGSVHSDGPKGRDGSHGNASTVIKSLYLIVLGNFLFILFTQ